MPQDQSLSSIEELVKLAQNGDHEAFGEIYQILVDPIYRYVLFKVNSHIDAQDITAETFKKAWVSLHRYQQNNFRAYLYAIARNTTVDYIRKEARISKVAQSYPVIDEKINIEDHLIKKEEIRELYQAIKKLPENYAEVINLRFVEELSIKETAEILEKSSVSVRVTQYRALRKLRDLLKYPTEAD